MDPISSSSFNLNSNCGEKDEEINEKQQYVSCRSLNEKRSFKNLIPQILATFVAASGHLAIGISLAFSAILIPQLQSESSDIKVGGSETSWIASTFVLIAPFGALCCGYLMDAIGRVATLKIAVVPGVLGWILMALSPNVASIIAARILLGISGAMTGNPAIVYITEIARPDMRGSLISLGPAFVSLGMVISYLKGWLMNWRTISWLCNIYMIPPFVLLFLIPESPAWLINKGRKEEARASLKWLYKYQPQPEHSTESFAELQFKIMSKEHEKKMLEAATKKSSKIRGFLKPTGYKPLLILIALFFFQQFSGIYIFLFYSITFFDAVGTSINPYIASICIGLVRLIMSLVNTYMLKSFKRRGLIMVSASGMAVCTFISGLFTYWIKHNQTTMNWVPVVFLVLYVVFSMVGLLSIPWTMTAELFPIEIRSMAHSTSTSLVNLMMFAAVQSYSSMEIFFGGSAGLQWFFSAVSMAAVFYTIIFLPETHGKKLVEIEEYFKHNTIYLGQKRKKDKPMKLLGVINEEP